MSSSLVFKAAKCLACGMPKAGAIGNWVVSSFLRTPVVSQTTRLFSRSPTSAAPVLQKTSNGLGLNSTVTPSSHSGVLVQKSNSFVPGLTPSNPILLASGWPTVTQTRGRAEIYYRPSAWKRVNRHSIEKRMRTQGGLSVLWRRFLRKRHSLTPFDRIIPGTYGGKILPDHHLKYNQHLVKRDVRKRVEEVIKNKAKKIR